VEAAGSSPEAAIPRSTGPNGALFPHAGSTLEHGGRVRMYVMPVRRLQSLPEFPSEQLLAHRWFLSCSPCLSFTHLISSHLISVLQLR
jgi:hypothetical protein